MAPVETAIRLRDAGRFTEALEALEHAKLRPSEHLSARVLRAELLNAVGKLSEARRLADDLLAKPRQLSAADRSTCEYVLGRIAREAENSNIAIDHLQRSL